METKKLDINEVGGALRSLGFYPTKKHLEEFQNKNPGVNLFTLQQFSSIISLQQQMERNSDHRRQLVEAFGCFDRNESGRVDASEVIHLMKTYGDNLEEHEVSSLWEFMESDGNLDYRKLIQ